jgi:hypothetical protein
MGPRDLGHHSKIPMMLRLHGSITPKLIIPVLLIGGWATTVTCVSKLVYDRKPYRSFPNIMRSLLTLHSRHRSSLHHRAGLCRQSGP